MKKVLFIVMLMVTSLAFSQVTVSISGMTYSTGSAISSCGNIDFGTNANVTVQFGINLSKPSNQVVGNSHLYVYTIGSSGNRIERKDEIVQSVSFNTNYSSSPSITIPAYDFSTSGGTLFAVFKSSGGVEYSSCSYTITKTQIPEFTLSPTAQTIQCGYTNPITFTVTNVHNSPGTLTYTWNVGSGWANNSGVPVSGTFTNSTASLTLRPNGYPLSNISVIPKLNGQSYPQKTSVITISPFYSPSTIIGESTICDLNSSRTYTLQTPPVGGPISVVWSSSDTAIATVSNQSSTGVTVNSLNQQGYITLTATITNSCGQTATKTKAIKVGNSMPNGINVQKATGYVEVCGNDHHYIFLEAINPDPTGSVYNYTFSDFNAGISNPGVTYVQITPKVFRVKIPKNKIPSGPYPTLVFNFTATNSCGISTSIYGKAITMDAGIIYSCNSPINSGWRVAAPDTDNGSKYKFTIYPNPSSDTVYIDSNTSITEDNSQVTIYGELYDLTGKMQSKTQLKNNSATIDVSALSKGIYILKINNGEMTETHQIMVE